MEYINTSFINLINLINLTAGRQALSTPPPTRINEFTFIYVKFAAAK